MGRDLYAIRKDGIEFPVEVGLSHIETEQGELILSATVDITVRKLAEEEIQRQASFDPLTGLVNYRRVLEVFGREAERAGRTGRSVPLLLLDLDGRKIQRRAWSPRGQSRALPHGAGTPAIVPRERCSGEARRRRVHRRPAGCGRGERADAGATCWCAARQRQSTAADLVQLRCRVPPEGWLDIRTSDGEGGPALYEMKRSGLRKAATSRD